MANLGETVDYQLIVTNTGNVPLKFSNFTDTKCEGIVEGAKELAPGEHTTYTCFHVINEVGDWVNFGTITGTPEGEPPITHTSNQVVVFDASFSIEKLQRLAGEASFTPFELSAKLGQVVQYEIIVKNTSNDPTDVLELHRRGVSEHRWRPRERIPVPPGESTIYTCEHTLTSVGPYANEASVEGSEQAGKKTSNKVVVNVEAGQTASRRQTSCSRVACQARQAARRFGSKRRPSRCRSARSASRKSRSSLTDTS